LTGPDFKIWGHVPNLVWGFMLVAIVLGKTKKDQNLTICGIQSLACLDKRTKQSSV